MSTTVTRPFGANGVPASRTPDRVPVRPVAAERRVVRRTVSVALLLIGVVAMVSGVWGLLLPRGSFALPVHVVAGSLFGLLSLAHVRLNRNAIRLYLGDLGWSPAALRLLLAAAISLAVLVPLLRLVQG